MLEYDLKGDLQTQTDWTDGSSSIEDMAKAAIKAGLEYIAITDHTKGLAMTGGLDDKRILKQMAEIDRVNKKFAGKIKVLKGTECDILKDGTLDLSDSVLSKLDVVGISVHSLFNLSEADQTARVKRAMSNPNADILFHPTGRLINERDAYEIDIKKILEAAKERGCIIELNAHPYRLDLTDINCKLAKEIGVKIAISTDAHSIDDFDFMRFGVLQARRGWLEPDDVINTRTLDGLRKVLKRR